MTCLDPDDHYLTNHTQLMPNQMEFYKHATNAVRLIVVLFM